MLSEAQIEQENKEIVSRYKDLLRTSYQTLSEEDKAQIRLAFEVAVDAHKDQRRKSGEAYVFHPIAVAQIVAEEIGSTQPQLWRPYFTMWSKIAITPLII